MEITTQFVKSYIFDVSLNLCTIIAEQTKRCEAFLPCVIIALGCSASFPWGSLFVSNKVDIRYNIYFIFPLLFKSSFSNAIWFENNNDIKFCRFCCLLLNNINDNNNINEGMIRPYYMLMYELNILKSIYWRKS